MARCSCYHSIQFLNFFSRYSYIKSTSRNRHHRHDCQTDPRSGTCKQDPNHLGSAKIDLISLQIGDSSVDPMARFSTPTEVNAFLDVFHKHGHDQLDTAAVYSPGAPYTSEPRIGAVLAGSRFKIDTKADWFEGHTKESVSRDIENSLKNLQIDQINIYYLQLPERVHPLKPVLEVLDQAHRDGKIKAWGISNYRADEVQKTIDICEENDFVKPSVYQGHYNPIVRGGEKELFPLLRKHGIAFYAYSPGAGGFFAQKHKNPEPMSRFSGSVSIMTKIVSQKLTLLCNRLK